MLYLLREPRTWIHHCFLWSSLICLSSLLLLQVTFRVPLYGTQRVTERFSNTGVITRKTESQVQSQTHWVRIASCQNLQAVHREMSLRRAVDRMQWKLETLRHSKSRIHAGKYYSPVREPWIKQINKTKWKTQAVENFPMKICGNTAGCLTANPSSTSGSKGLLKERF